MMPFSINIPITTIANGTNICHQNFDRKEVIALCLFSFALGWIFCLISMFLRLLKEDLFRDYLHQYNFRL